jgi:translation initiation factor 2 subunit 2
MNYDDALDRAMDSSPDIQADADRLTVPDAQAQRDGAFTRLTNLEEIADTVSRDPEHIHRFVQRELGTNGQYEEGVGRYNGTFSGRDFDEVIGKYVDTYVLCGECGLPDTRLVTEDRTEMLRCDACGAFRPVQKRRRTTEETGAAEAETVEEGETYELEIVDTGRKGDGVAKRGEYTIFVSGAREGETVNARINNTSGSLAFADIVERED